MANSMNPRRLLGTLFLTAAAVMLVLGLTVLQSFLKSDPSIFLFYWASCFLLTFLTLVAALLDVRAIRRRSRRERSELITKTWSDILDRDQRDHQDPQ